MAKEVREALLSQWEATYKKGLLTFWLLLLLSEREAYPYEIKDALLELSQNSIYVEDNSIYRSLRRLKETGIVDNELRSSDSGPDRRYFFLTELGSDLLARFIERNILVFQHSKVTALIDKILGPEAQKKG